MNIPARSAIFSLSTDFDSPSPPGAAEEAAPALLRLADGNRDCFVHRITSTAATLTVTGPIGQGERATIELPFGLSAEGAITGSDPAALAFRFDAPVDVVGALARCLAAQTADQRQMPRIELRQRLCVRHSGQVDFAWTRNLSPTGVGIELRAPLAIGQTVEITLDSLRPMAGEVRWAENGAVGIAFAEDMGWQTLMPWLRAISTRLPAPAPGIDLLPSTLGAIKDALSLDLPTQVRAGAAWWNARLTSLSNALTEFESATEFAPLTSLWLSLPGIGGWPIRVIECHGARHVAEFRVPLRPHEMSRLVEVARPR